MEVNWPSLGLLTECGGKCRGRGHENRDKPRIPGQGVKRNRGTQDRLFEKAVGFLEGKVQKVESGNLCNTTGGMTVKH
jgi:hypothetical protein